VPEIKASVRELVNQVPTRTGEFSGYTSTNLAYRLRLCIT